MRTLYNVAVASFSAVMVSSTALCQAVNTSDWASGNSPKREFRASWIATVSNLDWPLAPGTPPEVQQRQLTNLLDVMKSTGMNAVVFQIRPECDALYQSSIEPWSYWLTAQQGSPPSPPYDPLQFAIEEAHKRGMELHAWFNPYRSVRTIGNYSPASTHVSVTHPEWNLTIGNFRFLDPGLPQVRDYVTSVVVDVVRRYDVDAVHFDDYFYPYPPNQISNQDDATFAQYPNGFTSRGDWRRDNVHRLIRQVHDSIQAIKPHVKFGISPFGIWKNGVPPGITGLDAYSTIYCDAITWLRQQTIDYVTPQLYWRIGGPQDYSRLMPWWADSVFAFSRHLYTGHIFGSTYSPSELPNQVRLNRGNTKTHGSIFFRAAFFSSNSLGFADTLRTDLYRYPSLPPVMSWKDTVKPDVARNLRYDRLTSNGPAALFWDTPIAATDGDTASRYAVYRFDHSPVLPGELDDVASMISVEGRRYSTPEKPPAASADHYFVVTALDRNSNESAPSNVLMLSPPLEPALATPTNGSQVGSSTTLTWTPMGLASAYGLQVSTDSSLSSNFLVNQNVLRDTFYAVSGLEGQLFYYWRVRANNPSGSSSYADRWSFQSGIPATPLLSYPPDFQTNVPINLVCEWNPAGGVGTYHLQVSRTSTFSPADIDTGGLIDTSYAPVGLMYNTAYFWRVRATNSFGTGNWSMMKRFRTEVSTTVAETGEIPTEFALGQNYPNPFNSMTRIPYMVTFTQHVTLKVYDVLGRELATLVDEEVHPGRYSVVWDAAHVSSGTYFYVFRAGNFTATKRALLLR